MKIGFTINLGSYESMRVETSELPNIKLCLAEIRAVLSAFEHVEGVKKFMDKLEIEK